MNIVIELKNLKQKLKIRRTYERSRRRFGLQGGGGGVTEQSAKDETPDSPDDMPARVSALCEASLKLKILKISMNNIEIDPT